MIVHCTEDNPISHCRKNTRNVFVCVHAYQRDDCQAREYLIVRLGGESTFKYAPVAEKEDLQCTWLIHSEEKE